MSWIDYQERVCPKHGKTGGSVYCCDDCEGEGEINMFEADPLWYGSEEDGWETCETCSGKGYWWVCEKCSKERTA